MSDRVLTHQCPNQTTLKLASFIEPASNCKNELLARQSRKTPAALCLNSFKASRDKENWQNSSGPAKQKSGPSELDLCLTHLRASNQLDNFENETSSHACVKSPQGQPHSATMVLATDAVFWADSPKSSDEIEKSSLLQSFSHTASPELKILKAEGRVD